jgi:cytochrome c-type biogenesis protein
MHIFRKFRVLLLIVLIWLVLDFGKGALADDIILNDLEGQAVDVSSYKGKPVILFFWTSRCPYCRGELIKLNQQYLQMVKEGIVVFGVNVGESEDKVKIFAKDNQLNFKILLDKTGLLANKYGLLGVPTYILLDKVGQVISQYHSWPGDYKSLLLK